MLKKIVSVLTICALVFTLFAGFGVSAKAAEGDTLIGEVDSDYKPLDSFVIPMTMENGQEFVTSIPAADNGGKFGVEISWFTDSELTTPVTGTVDTTQTYYYKMSIIPSAGYAAKANGVIAFHFTEGPSLYLYVDANGEMNSSRYSYYTFEVKDRTSATISFSSDFLVGAEMPASFLSKDSNYYLQGVAIEWYKNDTTCAAANLVTGNFEADGVYTLRFKVDSTSWCRFSDPTNTGIMVSFKNGYSSSAKLQADGYVTITLDSALGTGVQTLYGKEKVTIGMELPTSITGYQNTQYTEDRVVAGLSDVEIYQDDNTCQPASKVAGLLEEGHTYYLKAKVSPALGYSLPDSEQSFRVNLCGKLPLVEGTIQADGTFQGEIKELIISQNGLAGFTRTSNVYDIKGFFDNSWSKTTYDGYYTFLYYGNDCSESTISNAVSVKPTKEFTQVGTGDLYASINLEEIMDGKAMAITYTIKNQGTTDITYSLGSAFDIKVGQDDGAPISVLDGNIGIQMVSSRDIDEEGNHLTYNLWVADIEGVTPVDHFWYGPYGSSITYTGPKTFYSYSASSARVALLGSEATSIKNGEEGVPEKFDSAGAFGWSNRTIAAGETQTFVIKAAATNENLNGKFTALQAEGAEVYGGTTTFSGLLNFANLTEVIKDDAVLVQDTDYTVDMANKTITFNQSLGLLDTSVLKATIGGVEITIPITADTVGPQSTFTTLQEADTGVTGTVTFSGSLSLSKLTEVTKDGVALVKDTDYTVDETNQTITFAASAGLTGSSALKAKVSGLYFNIGIVPATGDSMNLSILYAVIGLVAAAGITLVLFKKKAIK